MFIEVTVLEGPSELLYNKLHQNEWGFDIRYVEGEELSSGKIGLKGNQVLMGTEFPGLPYIFSWEDQLRSWSKDRDVIQGKSSLLRALALKKEDCVVDATMGLGKDTCQLLAFGAHVLAYERVAEVFFMGRAAQIFEGFLPEKLFLHYGPVMENTNKYPIYFDPMFDDGTKRKAKANKGMSAFHQLVGGDDDAIKEGNRLRSLTDRLVVKRPSKKKALLENVNSTWKGKAVSFDLFL